VPIHWLRRESWEIFTWTDWPGTIILPISASQVVEIIGLRHCAQPALLM
jgi:hypothetical protein